MRILILAALLVLAGCDTGCRHEYGLYINGVSLEAEFETLDDCLYERLTYGYPKAHDCRRL